MNKFTEWFNTNYSKLDGRFKTMKKALFLLLQTGNKEPNIVETGCTRQKNDWGAGMSTVAFCDFLAVSELQGKVTSVDINSRNLRVCEELTNEWKNLRKLICEDSVVYLKKLDANEKIDFLYLDSWDYPIIEICDLYGPRSDFEKNYQMLKELGDEEVLKRHGEMIAPSQNHCLKEIKAAMPHLHDKSIVLIDDTSFPGGGKSRLAEEYLSNNGWTMVLKEHQSLWIKGE